MGSTVVDSGVTRHGHRLVYVIVIQSLVILWLGLWAFEDYLNNIYVHSYVDGEIQAYGLIMLLGLVAGSVGGGWGFVHRRHKLAGGSVELVLTGAKGPVSVPKNRPGPSIASKTASTLSKAVTPTHAPAMTAASPITTSPPKSIESIISSVSPPAEASPKPSGEFHPAVAALKAEMSERRVSLGLMSATIGQDQSPAPAPKTESQSAPVSDRPIFSVAETSSNHKPEQTVQPGPSQLILQPPSMVRPTQPSPIMRPPQPEQGVRPMQPFPFGRPVQRPPVPGSPQQSSGLGPSPPVANERFEDAARKAGFQLAQSQQPQQTRPNPQSPPSIPRNVTTVITGIMPAKKKDENSKDDRSSSQ